MNTSMHREYFFKVTRKLLHWTGDTGAWLRTTMRAMVLFGIPPEEYYPYDTSKYDDEPDAFCYAFAQNYQSIKYYRLNTVNLSPDHLLERIKIFLTAGFPSMFGFTVYNFGNEKGEFEYPGPNDPVQGGHAIVAVGYDDNRKIGKDKGALKIRNSWGTAWGEGGMAGFPTPMSRQGSPTISGVCSWRNTCQPVNSIRRHKADKMNRFC